MIFMIRVPIFLFLILSWVPVAFADDTNSAAYAQARQEYREYLKQLKALNEQYKSITGEMKKVIQEEGLPTWDAGDLDLGTSWSWAKPQVEDTGKEMVVTAEMPGLDKRSIHVSFQDGRNLKITADKKTKQGTQAVEKVIELPAEGLEHGTKAKYEAGVLTITIPKVLETKREVSIPVQ